jgi:hypothetical protein
MIVMDQDHGLSMTGADLYHWIALRRVSDSGVTKLADRWLDRGHPVPDFVIDVLTELYERGLVALADSESVGPYPPPPVCRSAAGARFPGSV